MVWSLPVVLAGIVYAATLTLFVLSTKLTTAANAILHAYPHGSSPSETRGARRAPRSQRDVSVPLSEAEATGDSDR
jgi:hypothetical protein